MILEEGMDVETVRGSFQSGALPDKSGVLPGCGWIGSAVAVAGLSCSAPGSPYGVMTGNSAIRSAVAP